MTMTKVCVAEYVTRQHLTRHQLRTFSPISLRYLRQVKVGLFLHTHSVESNWIWQCTWTTIDLALAPSMTRSIPDY